MRCAREVGPECDVVLLGSIASPKYVDILTAIFGERLRFPIDFVGRGDMSRGGLLLRHAREGVELEYVPVLGASFTARGRRSSLRSRALQDCRMAEVQKGRAKDVLAGPPRPFRSRPSPCDPASRNLRSCNDQRCDSPRSGQRRPAVDGKEVRLTNLRKMFWPELGSPRAICCSTTPTSRRCCCRTCAIARW